LVLSMIIWLKIIYMDLVILSSSMVMVMTKLQAVDNLTRLLNKYFSLLNVPMAWVLP
jgi:hypothetical protein